LRIGHDLGTLKIIVIAIAEKVYEFSGASTICRFPGMEWVKNNLEQEELHNI
jgi:hypothetical protein